MVDRIVLPGKEKIWICDICGARLDHCFRFSSSVDFYSCPGCGFVKRLPDDLILDYENEYMNKELIDKSKILAKNYFKRLKEKINEGADVLEIGGSFGFFCKLLENQKKCRSINVEYSELAREYCNEELEIECIKDISELADDKKFDYIFSFHVLEHIEPKDIDKFFADISTLLKPGGRLFLFTPNGASSKIVLMKKHYPWLAYPEHISFITKRSAEILADRNKLSIEIIQSSIPSYYHYPYFSIVSSLVRKVLGKNTAVAGIKENAKEKKSPPFLIMKKLLRYILFIESIIFLPFYFLFDLFSKENDELVLIARRSKQS